MEDIVNQAVPKRKFNIRAGLQVGAIMLIVGLVIGILYTQLAASSKKLEVCMDGEAFIKIVNDCEAKGSQYNLQWICSAEGRLPFVLGVNQSNLSIPVLK
jgi:hypothetical protein